MHRIRNEFEDCLICLQEAQGIHNLFSSSRRCSPHVFVADPACPDLAFSVPKKVRRSDSFKGLTPSSTPRVIGLLLDDVVVFNAHLPCLGSGNDDKDFFAAVDYMRKKIALES